MLKIQKLPVGELEANCFLVYDEENNAVIIDPGAEPDYILSEIESLGLKPLAILLTHAHVDHALYARETAERFSAPVFLHRDDLPLYLDDTLSLFLQAGVKRDAVPVPEVFGDGETLVSGALEIVPVHTPGHTPGSVCYRIGDALFSGDTLMRSTIGRIDLPGGDRAAMLESCRLFARMQENPVLYPGHGDFSTMRREKEFNPYLRGIL